MIDFSRLDKDRVNHWTLHSRRKLMQYKITPNSVKRVMRNPDRKEEGIAKGTIASMKRRDSNKFKKELWVMYQSRKNKKIIISTWIYPGVSEEGSSIFIPDDVWDELSKFKK